MIWFGERNKLKEAYIKWVTDNSVADTPFNVITFLDLHNLLDETKVEEFLKDKSKGE